MRLATRIALSVTVVVPLMVLVAGLLLLGLVGRDLRQQQDVRLHDRASAVLPDVRALLTADRNGKPKAEQNQHRKVLGDVLDAGIRVRSADGAIVLEGGPQPAEAVRLPEQTPDGPVTVRAKGHAWRVLSVPVTGPAPGNLWIYTPASATDPQLAAVRRRVLTAAEPSGRRTRPVGRGRCLRRRAGEHRRGGRAVRGDRPAPRPLRRAGGPDRAGAGHRPLLLLRRLARAAYAADEHADRSGRTGRPPRPLPR